MSRRLLSFSRLAIAFVLATGCGARLCAVDPGGTLAGAAYPDHTRLLVYRDPSGSEKQIATADEWRVRRAHILAAMQEVMGPLPDESRRVPLAPELGKREETTHFVRQWLSLEVEPGDRLPCILHVPKQGGPRFPAMLCLHQTTKVGKLEPAGLAGLANLHYAAELAERGYVTLAVDYPNFGDYVCDPYARGYASATMKGIWNHMRATDYLVSLAEVDPARIGVIGHSLGGHNSLFVAAFDERIGCAVSSCGFCSFRRYFGGDLTGWSHKGYMPRIAERYERDPQRMPFDFTEVLAAIAPRAVLAVAPVDDGNFDVHGVVECVEAAEPVYAFLQAPGRLAALYPDAQHDFPLEAREAAYRWIDAMLPPEAR